MSFFAPTVPINGDSDMSILAPTISYCQVLCDMSKYLEKAGIYEGELLEFSQRLLYASAYSKRAREGRFKGKCTLKSGPVLLCLAMFGRGSDHIIHSLPTTGSFLQSGALFCKWLSDFIRLNRINESPVPYCCSFLHCFFASYFPQSAQVSGQLSFYSKYSPFVISLARFSSIRISYSCADQSSILHGKRWFLMCTRYQSSNHHRFFHSSSLKTIRDHPSQSSKTNQTNG